MQPQKASNSIVFQPQLAVGPTVVPPAVQMQPSSAFVVQAQPVVQPVLQMAPPPPMYQMVQIIDLQRGTVEICLDTDVWPTRREKAKRAWGSSLLAPLQMRGVGPQEWNIILNKLQEVHEANPFVSSCGEDSAACAECCYFCIPGGPIQYALCMLNPVTCCLYGAQEEKKKEAIQTAKPILEQRCVDLQIKDKVGKPWAIFECQQGRAIFECQQGRFQQPMQQPQIQMQQPQQYVVAR
jgi:hypothetical protein